MMFMMLSGSYNSFLVKEFNILTQKRTPLKIIECKNNHRKINKRCMFFFATDDHYVDVDTLQTFCCEPFYKYVRTKKERLCVNNVWVHICVPIFFCLFSIYILLLFILSQIQQTRRLFSQ